ncbi:hypothetical protein Scep_007422 [Stephania cephalantha]|uniref:Uncharacterized protein n=1 Tax=Stephania cephalantha TaxID=152367 RepID=A0AAP0KCI3_9MAGN
MKKEGFDQPPPTSHHYHHHQNPSTEIMGASKQQQQPLLEMMVGGSGGGGSYIANITLTSEGFHIEIFNGGRDGDGERTRVRKHDYGGEEDDDFDNADGERAEDVADDGGEEDGTNERN